MTLAQPDDPQAVVAFDAVGVFHQGRLVDDDFLFGHGGVDEGQGVAFPVGVGHVGDVQAGRRGVEADDVARLDVLDAPRQVRLGNVPVVPGFEVLLGDADLGHGFRIVLELLVGGRMVGHEVELLVEHRSAALAAHLVEDAAGLALDDPFRGVVQAGGVAVHLAVPVAEPPQVVHIFLESGLSVFRGERHGQAHLYEKDAVGLAGVDGQAFRLDLEGAGHVGRAQEMLGHLDDQLAHRKLAVGGQQVHHFLEILHVFLREARIALLIGGSAENKPEKGAQEYDCAFHIFKKGKPVSRILYPQAGFCHLSDAAYPSAQASSPQTPIYLALQPSGAYPDGVAAAGRGLLPRVFTLAGPGTSPGQTGGCFLLRAP